MKRQSIFPVLVLTLLMVLSLSPGLSAWAEQPPADAVGKAQEAEGPAKPQRLELDLDPSVTIFTEPLREDGTIDYIAALNQKMSEGVTNENNAFRGLFVLFDYGDWVGEEDSAIPGMMAALDLDEAAMRRGPHITSKYDYLLDLGQTDAQVEAHDDRHDADPLAAVQEPAIVKWIEQNKPAMKLALQAVNKPRYWAPLVGNDDQGTMIGVLLPYLSNQRTLARAMRDWAYLLVAQGEHGKAIEVIGAMRRLAWHTTHGTALIDNLVGISIDVLVLAQVKQLIATQVLNDAQLAELDKLLRERPKRTPIHETIMLGEGCMGLDTYMQMLSGRLGWGEMLGEDETASALLKKGGFDVNRGLRKISGYYKQLARALAIEDYAAQQRLVDLMDKHFEQEMADAKKRFFIQVGEAAVPNPVALMSKESRTDAVTTMFMAIMMPALDAAGRTETRVDAIEQCTYAAIAIERYRLKHGKLPERLTQLKPTYVDALPIDPFTGKPVLWKRSETGFTVYALGDNLKDDGGVLDRDCEDNDWGVEVTYPVANSDAAD